MVLNICFLPLPAISEESHENHSEHPATGKKIPSPGPKDVHKFLTFDDKKKTAVIHIITTYNDVNHGMNFNGYHKGMATYSIPRDWKVTVKFENRSPVPHSVVIVEKAMTKKLQVGEPYWEGAASKDYLKGIIKKDTFSFVADEAGKFAIACGFPTHAASGHWLSLNISKSIEKPSLTFNKKPN